MDHNAFNASLLRLYKTSLRLPTGDCPPTADPRSYHPAWVYYDKLAAGREDAVAEACSHEFGHNLGLSHDGTTAAGGGLVWTTWLT